MNFVFDLGGLFGFWIGMFVLLFVEVFELLLLIGYVFFRKLWIRLSGRIWLFLIFGGGIWFDDKERNVDDV